MTDPILLVEDDNADAMLIERVCRKAGIANPVHRVSHGDAAVDYLSGVSPVPTLLLLDLKLPRRSGFEVLTWIRAQQASVRRIPVIILTSSSESADINLAYDLGANSYLVKPGRHDQLLQAIEAIKLYWLALNRFPQ